MKTSTNVCMATLISTNALNILEMLRGMSAEQLEAHVPALMLSPALELMRQSIDGLGDLATDEVKEIREDLYHHILLDGTDERPYDYGSRLTESVRTVFHWAHKLHQEMFEAKNKFGLDL